MEQFIANQTKINEALGTLINKMTSKLDAMTTHHKAMDTQIAQQVSYLSWPQGHLWGQPETNPMDCINVVFVLGEGLEVSHVMVLQETIVVLDSARTDEQREKENLSCKGEICHPCPVAHPYQPPVPFPQRVAWAKLFQLEPKFARFLEALRRIYADTPFLKALKKAPAYL